MRGTAYSLRISPQIANRVALRLRSKLERVADDVYIATDARGARGGGVGSSTPGFGCSLTFETVIEEEIKTLHNPPIVSTLGVFVKCEKTKMKNGNGDEEREEGEEVEPAERMADRLFSKVIEEMECGGNVDRFHQVGFGIYLFVWRGMILLVLRLIE